MGGDFMTRLLTPSPIMLWLLLLLPATIALSGILGAAERETGNRRLALWALLLVIWLFLPLRPVDPVAAEVTGTVSILGWLGLVGYWARHVWINRPTPVWIHAVVIAHLVAIAVGCGVALIRTLAYSAPG